MTNEQRDSGQRKNIFFEIFLSCGKRSLVKQPEKIGAPTFAD
jgi:hypothetical protein